MPIDEAGRRLIAQRNGQSLGAGIVLPTTIRNEMDAVNQLIDGLGVAVNERRGKIAASTVKHFEQFWNEWKVFYARNAASWSGSVYDQAVDFRRRAVEWRDRLAKAGADVTPERLAPAEDTTKSVLMKIGIGVVVLTGLFIAGKLVHTILLGRSGLGTLGDAESAAVALMDAQRRRRRASRHRS